MGGHVFLCYARADQAVVLPIAHRLREVGVDAWIDQLSIEKGTNWDRAIDDALDSCEKFVIFLSQASVASDEVQAELRVALDAKKHVVPVLLQTCTIPRRLRLLQHIDLTLRSTHHEAAAHELAGVLGLKPRAPMSAAAIDSAAPAPARDAPDTVDLLILGAMTHGLRDVATALDIFQFGLTDRRRYRPLEVVEARNAILVIAVDDGPLTGTRESLRFAQRHGTKVRAAYMTNIDRVDDRDLIELVEMETRELLADHGYKEVPLVRATTPPREGIRALLKVLDQTIP